MKELLTLIEEFRKNIITGNVALQESIFLELDLVASDYPSIEQSVFEGLLTLLKDDAVQKSGDSAWLFKFFECNHDLLTHDQKRVLCETFEAIYPHYSDPASLILMLELLVDIGENKFHLIDTFSQYQKLKSSPAKTLLPCGLKYLYKHTKDPEMLRKCKQITTTLTRDNDENVRKEAEKVLNYFNAT